MNAPARALLSLAAAVVALESVAYIVVAVLARGVGLLLVVYGLGLLVAAWQVRQGRAWARAPLVVAQLIQLLLANDARQGAAWVTPAMAVSALVVLACLLAPPVTRALIRDRPV